MEKDNDTRKAKDDIIPEFGDLDFESEREEEQRRLEREREEREASRTAEAKPAQTAGRGGARGGRRGRPAKDGPVRGTQHVMLDKDTACLLGVAAVRLSYRRGRRVTKGEVVREALAAFLRKEAPEVLRAVEPADGSGTGA